MARDNDLTCQLDQSSQQVTSSTHQSLSPVHILSRPQALINHKQAQSLGSLFEANLPLVCLGSNNSLAQKRKLDDSFVVGPFEKCIIGLDLLPFNQQIGMPTAFHSESLASLYIDTPTLMIVTHPDENPIEFNLGLNMLSRRDKGQIIKRKNFKKLAKSIINVSMPVNSQ